MDLKSAIAQFKETFPDIVAMRNRYLEILQNEFEKCHNLRTSEQFLIDSLKKIQNTEIF